MSTHNPTDAEIIARSRERPEEFSVLYQRRARAVFSYVAARLGPEIAEDLTSDVFLIAFERLDRYDTGRAHALPWLLGIATRLIRRHRRDEIATWRVLAEEGAAAGLGRGLEPADDSLPDLDSRIDAAASVKRIAALAGPAALADGQVLRIEEHWEGLGETNAVEGEAETPGETVKYREAETIVTRVPRDLSADWTVWRSGRTLVEVLDAHGDPDPEATVKDALADSGPDDSEDVWPGGIQPGSDADPIRRDAPTDRDELSTYILREVGDHEGPREESVFEWLLPVVSNPAASAELRAAGFEVLSELGSITAQEGRNGAERTVSMETGDGTTRRDLIFDADGALTEMREVLIGDSSPWLAGIEPGTVLSSVRIDARAVSAAEAASADNAGGARSGDPEPRPDPAS
ncbi:MAG: RNA polymerase sigma factor [Leucobacter sp.]